MSVFFGTAGESESFRAAGHKTSLEVPAYTAGMGTPLNTSAAGACG